VSVVWALAMAHCWTSLLGPQAPRAATPRTVMGSSSTSSKEHAPWGSPPAHFLFLVWGQRCELPRDESSIWPPFVVLNYLAILLVYKRCPISALVRPF
jgi:hypothetical protein